MWIISDALLKDYGNLLSLQARGGEYSADICLDGELSVPLSTTVMPLQHWLRAKTTALYVHFQSGTMYGLLTEPVGEELLTLFQEDFRVRTYPSQGKEKGLKGNVQDFGGNSRELFARWDRSTCSWRTPQPSLFVESTLYSGTWPKWGMMRRGACSAQTILERRTFVNASGSSLKWPTPVADDAMKNDNPAQRRRRSPPLSSAVHMFPTPKASDSTRGDCPSERNRKTPCLESHVRMWPTPRAQDTHGRRISEKWRGEDLVSQVTKEEELLGNIQPRAGGRLNPMWVEWLMGWPIGWTGLEPLETDRFQQWLREHSDIYTVV